MLGFKSDNFFDDACEDIEEVIILSLDDIEFVIWAKCPESFLVSDDPEEGVGIPTKCLMMVNDSCNISRVEKVYRHY